MSLLVGRFHDPEGRAGRLGGRIGRFSGGPKARRKSAKNGGK